MKLITRARQAHQAFRNVGRLREIVSSMSRFGFDVAVTQLKLRRFRKSDLGGDEKTKALPIEARLRLLLEDLGPTFIKIGQIMANRPDIFPQSFIEEFSKLQDEVAPLDFEKIKPRIEAELGAPIEDCFEEIDEKPLGSASIAQVHKATLKSGEKVVLKVRKPDVEKVLLRDLEILEALASLADSNIDEVQHFHLPLIAGELKDAILKEADFSQEAQNMKRFAENFKDSDFLVIPKVYPELSSDSLLVMEFLEGVKLSDISTLEELGADLSLLMSRGLDCFMRSILIHGLFHSDPHGGNVLVLDGNRMGLIDFGAACWLSQRSKNAIINMFLALVAEDYESLVMEYLLISPPEFSKRSSSRIESIHREVANLFGPYHGRPIKEIPAGKLLFEATGVAYRNEIVLPQDLIFVFKSIVTLEGIGRKLDPNLDLLGPASEVAKDVFKDRWNIERLGHEALTVARDGIRFVKLFPRQVTEILRQIEDGEIHVKHKVEGFDQLVRIQSRSSKRTAMAIVSAAALGAATASSITHAFPFWAEVSLWSACAFFFVLLFKQLFFSKL